jgi:hypothetical protein
VWVLDRDYGFTEGICLIIARSQQVKPEAKLWCVVLRNVYVEEIILAEGININKTG